MAIPYQPKARQIVFCDFRGFEAPEMVKRRPVVVLAAHKANSKLVAVVPLSTTEPKRPEPYHCQLRQSPVPDSRGAAVWAKCDMVAVVSTARLDLIRLHRRRAVGRRAYMTERLDPEQFDDIRREVAHALGLGMIVADPERGFRDSG
jgi:uncharacterized protein YifN (PemK superfamily)